MRDPVIIGEDGMGRVRLIATLIFASAVGLLPTQRLPGCTFRRVTGLPCPFCGFTTSAQHAVRLRPKQAARAHPLGLVAVVASVILMLRPPRALRLPRPGVLAVGGTALWTYQLTRSTGTQRPRKTA